MDEQVGNMQEQSISNTELAQKTINVVKKMSHALGIPVLYDIDLCTNERYSSVISILGMRNDPQSLMFCDYEKSKGFINIEKVNNSSIARLARLLGYYAVQQYAFSNCTEENQERFKRSTTRKGIGLYFQYVMRQEMHNLLGYPFNNEEELSLASAFRSEAGIGAEIGWSMSKELNEESKGQKKSLVH